MCPEVKQNELAPSEVEKLSSVARSCMAGPGSVRPEGLYFVAVEPNSFGLPSVDTCPGSTDYCEQDCYAVESERRTATHEKLQRNLDILIEAEGIEGMAGRLKELVDTYQQRSDKLGVEKNKRRFRIHWSGDFFSTDYASAWRTAIEENPELRFFTYTRSFQTDVNVVPILNGTDNLDLFMSVDKQNVERAYEVISDNPGVKVAYLVDYLEDSISLIDRLGRNDDFRNVACPENMRKANGERRLSIINRRGGACSRCTYCIDKPGNWDVVFVKTGLDYRAQGEFSFAVPVEISHAKKEKSTQIAQPLGAIVAAETQDTLF